MMQRKIKICHVISAFYRYDTRIFWKQCRSLANAGYEVVLVANDNLERSEIDGVTVIPSGFTSTSRFKRLLFSRKALKKMALQENADIYQIHDPELLPLAMKLKRIGKKVIYDSHEDLPRQILEKEWIPVFLRKIISIITEIYLNRVLKKTDSVITVTPHIVDILKKATDKVFLITNFPIIEQGSDSFSKEEYLMRSNAMCYSGTVYKTSQQSHIIDSIESIDNIKYIIVGGLDGKLYEDLKLKSGWSKVQYIQTVPKAELIKIYGSVTIGIVLFAYSPNMGNNFGTLGNNKIFEYMYHGLPIICTDFILWKEIVNKYQCGICVDPYDIKGLQDAVKYLTENKSLAYEMGQNGRRAVLSEYNWSTQEKVYLEVVDNIAKKL